VGWWRGEAGDQGGDSAAPEAVRVRLERVAAQLHPGDPLAQGIELQRRIGRGPVPEQSLCGQRLEPPLKSSERLGCRIPEWRPRRSRGAVVGALISKIPFRDPETLRRRAFGSYLAHPERVAADLLDVALLGINLPGTADTNRAILQAVATIRGWRPELRLDDALAAVTMPTLFVCGEHDSLCPPDIARELTTRMPDAHITVIPDAGHIPHLDQPEPVATALNQFLGQTSI
jgi:pimeloyl-ACP methyl ester carboxylesterase